MQKENQNKKIKNGSGFSFIEVIISIFLITVGLVASVDLITNGLRDSIDSRDQLIAAGLSQEGVELVRNVRDNNWVQGVDSFTDFPATSGEICWLGFTSGVDSMSCGTPAPETGDDIYAYSSSFYGINNSLPGSTKTKFQRRIIVEGGGASTSDRQIYSVVTWGGNIGDFSSSGDLSECTTASKCVHAEITLSKWGEGVIN